MPGLFWIIIYAFFAFWCNFTTETCEQYSEWGKKWIDTSCKIPNLHVLVMWRCNVYVDFDYDENFLL